jgi:hypothetical protein
MVRGPETLAGHVDGVVVGAGIWTDLGIRTREVIAAAVETEVAVIEAATLSDNIVIGL